jgi:rod shape-determining protein MreB
MSTRLGIDLGTWRTRLVAQGRGVLWSDRTLVARGEDRATTAIGTPALARDRSRTELVRPLRGGHVVDSDALDELIYHLLARAESGRWRKPDVLLAIPGTLSREDRAAWRQAVSGAGARSVTPIPAALLAAIGAGLPVTEPVASLVIHAGAGAIEAAVVCYGGLLGRHAERVGALDIDERLITWLRRTADLWVDEATAGQLRQVVGVDALQGATQVSLVGRDLSTGQLRQAELPASALAEPMRALVTAAHAAVVQALAPCPPDAVADVATGALLTGGLAGLPGLAARLGADLGLPVMVADDADEAVVRGLIRLLDEPALLPRLLLDPA